jgi:hypothetical protein
MHLPTRHQAIKIPISGFQNMQFYGMDTVRPCTFLPLVCEIDLTYKMKMDPWAKNPYILYQVDSANIGGITHERWGGGGGGKSPACNRLHKIPIKAVGLSPITHKKGMVLHGQ